MMSELTYGEELVTHIFARYRVERKTYLVGNPELLASSNKVGLANGGLKTAERLVIESLFTYIPISHFVLKPHPLPSLSRT